jgi:TetR/AcrR family transcriptional repressor of nem operon
MARTISFDREEILQKAMDIFWQEGYCKCSIASLVEATGLQPGSIYAAFGSKEGLFLATLAYYGQQSRDKLQNCLDTSDTQLGGIQKFIELIGEALLNESENRGCFLVNTVLGLSPGNCAIKQEVTKYLNTMEAMMHAVLDKARDTGELSSRSNPQILAKYLMVSIWGLQVFAKTNPAREAVRGVLDQIFAGLRILSAANNDF